MAKLSFIDPEEECAPAIFAALFVTISFEPLFLPLPNIDWDSQESVLRSLNVLDLKLKLLKNQEEVLKEYDQALRSLALVLHVRSTRSNIVTSLGEALPDPVHTVQSIYSLALLGHERCFPNLWAQIKKNADTFAPKCEYLKPADSGLSGQQLFDTYLNKTCFHTCLEEPVSYSIPTDARYSHTHIIGETGSGKSTLLKHLISEDLKTSASVIVVDPHKQLVSALAELKLDRRMVIVDPRNAPGINIFDVKNTSDPAEARQVFADAVKMLSFLFDEGGTSTTGKQTNVYKHLCRLMISRTERHGPQTLRDLLNFLDDPAPFQPDIASQPDIARSFFKKFIAKTPEYRNTAGELSYRLEPILSDDALAPIFTAPKTELDLRREMDDGSLVIINADLGFLGDMAPVFGKIFLALIMQTAREREPGKGRPTFVYVDEAHHFLDDQVEALLTDGRKFNVGCIFAHHNLAQIPTPIIKAALQGCAIKFAGGVRAEDAQALAADMRTSREFILAQTDFRFALHVRGQKAISVRPPKDPLAEFARLSEEEQEALRQRPPPRSPVSPATPDTMSDEY